GFKGLIALIKSFFATCSESGVLGGKTKFNWRISRMRSTDPKKKTWSRRIGPPELALGSQRSRKGTLFPDTSEESSALLRWKAEASPCHWLVPLLLTTLTTPPEPCPNSAP